MTDATIREHHGCACRTSAGNAAVVTVWENETHIYIDSYHHNRALTEGQARYLAAKLYRLSRRIRTRKVVE